MSEIRAKLVLTNAYDEMSAEKGLIKPGEVRRVEVEGLVD
ncbi:clan AA aspartic protease, partial [Candidatus Poribacteria bacterium]